MKETRFVKILVLFCIILSFLSSNHTVNAGKYSASEDLGDIEVKTNPPGAQSSNVVSAKKNANGTMNIVASNTGNRRNTNFYVRI